MVRTTNYDSGEYDMATAQPSSSPVYNQGNSNTNNQSYATYASASPTDGHGNHAYQADRFYDNAANSRNGNRVPVRPAAGASTVYQLAESDNNADYSLAANGKGDVDYALAADGRDDADYALASASNAANADYALASATNA